MGIRTGKQYLEGLKKGKRDVWLRGERIEDITKHPTFLKPLAHTAALYDAQHDPRWHDTLTFESPSTGDRVSTSFMPCRNAGDVARRGEAYRIMAEQTFGMMGRSPDFCNSSVFGMAEYAHILQPLGDRFAQNMKDYCEFIRENDLFLTHALVAPQNDRSKASSEQSDPFLHLGMVRETADGIIVRGARMLATMGPVADEVICYNYPPIPNDAEARYSLVFALPISTPGIRQICREPYDDGGRSSFDHPLASNFEDMDTLMIFDDVLVPWHRVFSYNKPQIGNDIVGKSSMLHHHGHQALRRALVKLEFVVGIAMRIAKTSGAEKFLHVQQMLGECVSYIETLRSCVSRTENDVEPAPGGTVQPNIVGIRMGRIFMSRVYPRVVEILQTIGGGGLQMLPCVDDFASPIGELAEKYYQGAAGISGSERVGLYKLAWDICGEAFGSRQVQYERYHSGDPVRVLATAFMSYDRERCDDLVDRAMSLSRLDFEKAVRAKTSEGSHKNEVGQARARL
jgi:anthranilate 3-monooxygenase (FAD)/4-hydroxyphenylacetate 3-monooxygenase